jgi:hypothetical protein
LVVAASKLVALMSCESEILGLVAHRYDFFERREGPKTTQFRPKIAVSKVPGSHLVVLGVKREIVVKTSRYDSGTFEIEFSGPN